MDVGHPAYFEWIASSAEKGAKIGFDPSMIPTGNSFYLINYVLASYKIRSKFFLEKGLEIVPITQNLIDEVWQSHSKPPMPKEPVFVHEVKYSGRSVEEKFKLI